jgi:hypothetical protein
LGCTGSTAFHKSTVKNNIIFRGLNLSCTNFFEVSGWVNLKEDRQYTVPSKLGFSIFV